MKTAVYNLLTGDATLMATLTGGLHVTSEISRTATPSAYDANSELLPCGLLRQETATPWGPHHHSGRLYLVIYLYDRTGYDSIETARKRIYELLHRVQVIPTDGSGNYDVRHSNDLLDMEDPALGAAMVMSRYVATVQRG